MGTRSISQTRLHFFNRKDCKNIKNDNNQEQDSLNKKFSLKNLKDFMEITPKFNKLRIGLKYMVKKEYIIYKVLLDVLGSYIRNFKGI